MKAQDPGRTAPFRVSYICAKTGCYTAERITPRVLLTTKSTISSRYTDCGSVGYVEVAQIKQAVDLGYLLYLLLRESVAVESDSVESHIRDGLAGSLHEGRNVFVDEGAALKHDVLAEVAELMHEAASAYYGAVVDLHLAGQLGGVGDNHAVADAAVVGDVGIGHDEAVLADHSLTFGRRSAVDGGTFAQRGAVAYDGERLLTLEFEVLRNAGHHGAGEDGYIVADARTGENGYVAVYHGVVADFHIVVDSGEIADADVIAYYRARMDVNEFGHLSLWSRSSRCRERTPPAYGRLTCF